LRMTATFEKGFDKLYYKSANDPVGNRLLHLDGISPRKVDVGQMSHDYFTKKLADTSVDTNANANEELSANNYQAEVTKGILKLEGYYLLWRYSKKRLGTRRANELLNAIWRGELYLLFCLQHSPTDDRRKALRPTAQHNPQPFRQLRGPGNRNHYGFKPILCGGRCSW